MSTTFTRRVDITDPDDRLAWKDVNGNLRDFTGWVLSMEIIDPATNNVEYLKLTGVVGSDGTGQSNVAIAWNVAEMAPLSGSKRWLGRVLADFGSERAEFVIDAANTLPVWVFQPIPIIL